MAVVGEILVFVVAMVRCKGGGLLGFVAICGGF